MQTQQIIQQFSQSDLPQTPTGRTPESRESLTAQWQPSHPQRLGKGHPQHSVDQTTPAIPVRFTDVFGQTGPNRHGFCPALTWKVRIDWREPGCADLQRPTYAMLTQIFKS